MAPAPEFVRFAVSPSLGCKNCCATRGKEAELMHPISNCARRNHSPQTLRRHWLTQGLVCLGSLLAGATLVALAVPTARPLSAGATAGQSVPQVGLLDFTATWCGPCQQMSPVVETLQRQGYPIYKVDVDQRPDLARQFRITGMPTFVLVVNGQEVMRQTGATSETQLRRMLLQIPEYQRMAAAEPPKSLPATRRDQFASANPDPDFGPSPFTVELGAPQAEPPRTVAASVPPSRPKFGLPFFNRNNPPATRPAAAEPADPVVRAQSEALGAVASDPVIASDPLQASTRLRVKDQTGVNYGSGTVIHSRAGRTLILTCGHIFRGMDANGVVEVDVFDRSLKPQTFVGRVLNYDLESDVGLVVIPTSEPLPAIPLASIDRPLTRGAEVLSIGCGGGELPSREQIAVTAINKYDGPDTIECTGYPVLGRSGGGLFRGNELVGVCIAADPKDRRGVYTALTPVYELLEQAGCGHLLPVGQPAVAPDVAAAPAPKSASPPAAPEDSLVAAALAAGLTDAQAADELQTVFAGSPDAEVICIVRPRDPRIPSRTVIIHQASPKLVGYLLDSVDVPAASSPPANVLAQTDALIPTTAQERSPFSEGRELGAAAPLAPLSRPLGEPTRPLSPRAR
jgi:thiol-disulfide isomerase/thioredoxin